MHELSPKTLELDHAVFSKKPLYLLNYEMLSDIHTAREKLFLWPWCCSQLLITKKPLNASQHSYQ